MSLEQVEVELDGRVVTLHDEEFEVHQDQGTGEDYGNEADDPGLDDDTEDAFDDDDNLDSLLSGIDIDRDFNLWNSFRSSDTVRRVSSGGEDSPEKRNNNHSDKTEHSTNTTAQQQSWNAVETQDMQFWASRIEREEVYSRRYRPTALENQELLELEAFLGNKGSSKRILRGRLFRTTSSTEEPNSQGNRKAWNALIHPEAPEPISVILKRGPVLVVPPLQSSSSTTMATTLPQEAELILLTHGFIVAVAVTNTSRRLRRDRKKNLQQVVERRFDRAVLWSQVEYVAHGPDTTVELCLQRSEGLIESAEGETLRFMCAHEVSHQAWLDAIEKIMIEYNIHHHTPRSQQHELGWQYCIVHKPGFTLAVTNRNPYDSFAPSNDAKSLDTLDVYNGMAPIHYATRAGNLTALEVLLQNGADPNLPDREERTPMYYAKRDQAPPEIVRALELHGAEPCSKVSLEQEGALFGQVAAAEAKATERRRQEQLALEQKQKAEQAQAEMNENMRLLQQRGIQIDEMDDKAHQLSEGGKNFADMAAQLKQKTKAQRSWLPFS